MRFLVSTVTNRFAREVAYDASSAVEACRLFKHEDDVVPEVVQEVDDDVSPKYIDGWCSVCDGPIFEHQDWTRSEYDIMQHDDPEDCEAI